MVLASSAQIETRPFGLRFAGVEPREREQLLHDFAQMHDFLQHAAGAVAQFRIKPRVFSEIFQFAAQNRQRRAQVMRGIGDKPFGILKGVVQPRDHAVERNGQPLQFIAGAGDRQTFAQIVLRDALGGARDLFDRRQGPPHQQIAAAGDDDDRQRQTQGELQKQVVEHRFHRIQQRAKFHEVSGIAGRFEIQRGDEQGFAARQFQFAGEFRLRRRRKNRNFRRIETAVFGRAGNINQRAIGARDADEAVVDFRLIPVFRLAGDVGFAGLLDMSEQGVGNLACAAGLRLAQVVFQKMPQVEIQQRAQQQKNPGEQAGIPGDQSEADGARVHVCVSSLKL